MSSVDPAVFYWFEDNELKGVLAVHVDDFIWAGSHEFESKVINRIRLSFLVSTEENGIFRYVGLRLSHGAETIELDQFSYVENILPIVITKARTLQKESLLNQLECYMDWFPSLICKNYIFKHFVRTIEPTSLKFCKIIELITLHLECTNALVKYANFSFAHAQTFVLLNGEMATVSTGFRKLKFWLWLPWTVFYLNQTGF